MSMKPRRRFPTAALLGALLLSAIVPSGASPAAGQGLAALREAPRPICGGSALLRRAAPVSAVGLSPSALQRRLARIKLVSYFPAYHPWRAMWTQWDPRAIDADFGRAASLHANSIRIALQAWTIGYPTPVPAMLGRLDRIIAMAHRHQLRVQITLFDWWSNWGEIAASENWACTVLAPYIGDSRIAFIEVKNEVDTADPGAIAWARALVSYTRSISGGIPVTLSAFRISDLRALARDTHPDFFSYHLIAGAEHSFATLQLAQQLAAPRPLFVGEEGTSTLLRWDVRSGCTIAICSEALQDHHFRTVAYAAQQLGLPPVAPWILSDFAPHTLTWNPPQSEYDFGLFHVDGTPKQVVGSVSSYFKTGTISTTFNNGFEVAAGDLPAQWRTYHGWQGRFARDTTVAHTGRASARISGTTSDPSGGPAFFISPISATVVPGRLYSISAWARGLNLSGETRIALSWFDAKDAYLGQIQSPTLAGGTTSWTRLSASGLAPVGASYAQIHLKSFDNRGTVWYDDVDFR